MMSRLRNRITKATFWTDGDVLRWPRDKRFFYMSLWSLAEDSCCIADDPLEWKVGAWASPLDAGLTIERFEAWRDELIEEQKLVPYEVSGRRYLYIPTMAEHEHPRNPQSPDLPLPPWVKYEVTGEGKGTRHVYTHSTDFVGNQYGVCTDSPVLSSPVQSCPTSDLLSVLRRYSKWNGDKTAEKNEAQFREDFPLLDLVETAKDWATWAEDAKHPPKNCWASFRNWCKKAEAERQAEDFDPYSRF